MRTLAEVWADVPGADEWDVICIESALRGAGAVFVRHIDRLMVRGREGDYSRTLRWVATPASPGSGSADASGDLEVRRAPDRGYQIRFQSSKIRRWGHARYSLDRVVAIVTARQDPMVPAADAWRLVLAPDVAQWVDCPTGGFCPTCHPSPQR